MAFRFLCPADKEKEPASGKAGSVDVQLSEGRFTYTCTYVLAIQVHPPYEETELGLLSDLPRNCF
jgi:hypothetical protein